MPFCCLTLGDCGPAQVHVSIQADNGHSCKHKAAEMAALFMCLT